jgi:hypothetical protein
LGPNGRVEPLPFHSLVWLFTKISRSHQAEIHRSQRSRKLLLLARRHSLISWTVREHNQSNYQ